MSHPGSGPARLGLPAVPVFLVQRVGVSFGLACWMTYANVRRVTELGFDPVELGLVGAVLGASMMALEIPTGVYADAYGRRRSIIQGVALVGAAFWIESLSSGLAGVLAAQATLALGWTLISGARAAWLADEIGETRAAPVLLQAAQVGHAGSLAGIAAAGLLVHYSVSLPLQVGAGACLAVAAFLALCMDETGFRPEARPERGFLAALADPLRRGAREVRGHRAAATVVVAELFLGASGEAFDRLWQLHLLEATQLAPLGPLTPLSWFAVIEAAAYALAIPALGAARRFATPGRLHRLPRLLAVLQACATVAALGFAMTGSFAVAVAAWVAFQVLRRTVNPVSTVWVNLELDSRVRATVLSVVNQATGLGETAGSPLAGAVGRVFGVRVALAAAAGVTLPAIGLFARGARRR